MTDSWKVVDLNPLAAETQDLPVRFKEVLREESMQCGLYFLERGSKDMQTPHDEDEMYYVIKGRAKLKLDGVEQEVKPGMLLFIKASQEHAFFEIDEDMVLLVVFA